MSLLIRNISGAIIEIDDLGIRLDIAEDYNLTAESAADVAESEDLVDAVTNIEIIALDPLDNITPLSQAQSIEAIQASNDTHFRIRGGELGQLDDVLSTTPNDTYVLTYITANNRWEPQPPSGGGGSTNTCFPFWKADGTYDPITVVAGQFPFFKADGTQDNILIQVC